jgi:hypothetical protein
VMAAVDQCRLNWTWQGRLLLLLLLMLLSRASLHQAVKEPCSVLVLHSALCFYASLLTFLQYMQGISTLGADCCLCCYWCCPAGSAGIVTEIGAAGTVGETSGVHHHHAGACNCNTCCACHMRPAAAVVTAWLAAAAQATTAVEGIQQRM